MVDWYVDNLTALVRARSDGIRAGYTECGHSTDPISHLQAANWAVVSISFYFILFLGVLLQLSFLGNMLYFHQLSSKAYVTCVR